jgi:biotin-dependent carboxylase-like uncharacterized protein
MNVVELRLSTVGLASVQDLGRPGLAHLGIAENGAGDGWAARVANVLAGNAIHAPLVEIVGSELTVTANTDLLVGVTGAADHILVNGYVQPSWETLVVTAGHTLTVPAPQHGLRSYLAFNGLIDVAPTLGSVAPDRLLGIGRALRSGETLPIRSHFSGVTHPYFGLPLFRFGAVAPPQRSPIVVETTPGPDTHEFHELRESGLTAAYEVSPQSDAIGLRLLGPTPERSTSAEILSRGVPVGAIEVPPAGGLLLLLRGRLVTAGYPVVGVATLDSINQLGQARPGDIIRFRQVDTEKARTTYRHRLNELDQLTHRVHSGLAAVGLGHILPTPTA